MIRTMLTPRLRRLALFVAMPLMAAASLATAGTIHVVLDTSAFGATEGYADMQLSASAGVPLATAQVTNLSGFDPGFYTDSWGVAKAANGYLFRNDVSNDLYQGAHLGGNLSFDLAFAGAVDPATAYVSTFVVSLYDANGAPLGNYAPLTGALATFSWTPATSAAGTGSVDIAISDTSIVNIATNPAGAGVPEPSAALLIGAGFGALWMSRRRQAALRRHNLPRHVS